MAEIKRFTENCMYGTVPSTSGKFVLLEDHERIVKELQAKIGSLLDTIEDLEGDLAYANNN